MAKPVKKRRATAEAEASLAADPRLQPGSARGWSSAQVLGVLCVGLAVGGFGGYTARGSGKTAQSAAAPAETVEGPRVDPSAALRQANAKFERRFRRMEALAASAGGLGGRPLAEQEALWKRAKVEEGSSQE